jgi:hypothetical protein
MKNKKNKLDVVMITFPDHSADLEGRSRPFHFLAVGVLAEETEHGYHLAHWTDISNPSKPMEDVSTYVAKVKGLKLTKLTHIIVPKE